MFLWYKNLKAEIYFDKYPFVVVRYYVPSMSAEEKKSIKKYPFISKKELTVCLKDIKKDKQYEFTIPKNYCYDGASIPRLFWRIIGANTDNNFLIAAMIHDVLCEHHEYINNDRSFSTNVFDTLLESSGVCRMKRFLMKNSVALYQAACCKWR